MPVAGSSSLIGVPLDGRYAIVREIGRGGMGVVYEAEHVDLGKRVAIKVMLDKYANDAEAIARFKREALAASRIGNPHIIDVDHIGTAPDGRPFVVMELLDGEPLAKILEATGPMQPWRAVHIMRQVLRAVGAAHHKGIIHRDLKPDNIFIVNRDDEHDFVKLLDFGISKIVDTAEQMAATRLTTTGMVMGTPLYMAPEQAMGAPAERGVDIYACGVILFEMLAGRPPFDEANYNMLVAKLLTAAPPHLAELRPGLPRALVTAVHHALEKDPDLRFATAEAFAQALPNDRAVSEPNLEILATLPPGTPGAPATPGANIVVVPTPPELPRHPRSGSRRWIGAVLALAGAAAIAAAIVLGKGGAGSTAAGAGSTSAEQVPAPAPAPAPAPVPEPVAKTGKLEIQTIPAGAAIRIDGADAGSTPIEVTVKPGRHQLHVELANYAAIDAEQEVRSDERTSAVITLQPAPVASPSKHPRPSGGPNKIVTTTHAIGAAAAATGDPVNPYGPAGTETEPTPQPKTRPGTAGAKSMPNPY